ncbi:hypothetical protein NADFUDRAFT_43540 [Nadsonia fulvescens var. elongata DSM 6958]|uniref:Uncharacterized protein n=1 Tax=Nadsonia fulvescens var. elongata DSM 6958 TaxID=857566 RepID=A0A1E3PEQ5_9ASCO|nr:hypothetical protein NADFUDRAFT_43540 [Nadsonia fulvescens var. elongata DSM 6958]
MAVYDGIVNGNQSNQEGEKENSGTSSKPSRFSMNPKTKSFEFNVKERSHKNLIEKNQRFAFKLWQNAKINNVDNSEQKLKLKEYSDRRKGWENSASMSTSGANQGWA